MGKLDVAPRQQASPPSAPAEGQPSLLRRYWDSLAVVLLMLASFPAVWLAHRSVTFFPDLGLIDDHWHLDATFKALHGIWIGRDVAFTHGPIFQWLSALPARTMPVSFGTLYATWNTIPLWCAMVFAYVAMRLVLPHQPPWKRFVLLLLIGSFWELSLRTTVPVLLFAVFLRGWYAVQQGRLRSAFAGIAGAVMCVLAFLVASDTGTYATAAWFICLIAMAIETRREKFELKLLSGLVAFLLAFAAVAVVVNSFMGLPLDFRFWRDSLQQVSIYRWATPAAMTDQGATRLFGGLAITGAIFLWRALSRRTPTVAITQRTSFLLGAFLFGLVVLQSALVRSDMGHVIIGQFALVFFAAAILFSFEGSASMAGVLIAIACSLLFARPVFRPSNLTRLYTQLRHPITQCPAAYNEFDQACYVEPLTTQMLTSTRAFLQQNSGPNDSIFVFPYQTMFGLAARRNVAGGLMQAYTASGPYLTRLEISGLDGKRIPAALYMSDADMNHWPNAEVQLWSRNYLSIPVDGIPNFTRTPEVWFWMVRHYRTAQQLMPGVLGLQRDDSRAARISLQAHSLGLPARTYAITERDSATNIGTPDWPAGFDFIRLRINVHYPIWWKLRKPERLQLEITRADGSRDIQWVVLPPNVSTDIWFYPWDAPDLAAYFNADAAQWRPNSRPAVTGLRLLNTPLDWVSQQPTTVTIEAADAVKLVIAPQ